MLGRFIRIYIPPLISPNGMLPDIIDIRFVKPEQLTWKGEYGTVINGFMGIKAP
jgi:hypothetical protein